MKYLQCPLPRRKGLRGAQNTAPGSGAHTWLRLRGFPSLARGAGAGRRRGRRGRPLPPGGRGSVARRCRLPEKLHGKKVEAKDAREAEVPMGDRSWQGGCRSTGDQRPGGGSGM